MKNFHHILKLPAPLLLLLSSTHATLLPYNPTRIFPSPQNDRLAYVLRPASGPQFSISSLDLSSRLTPSSLSYTAISPTLPFLTDGAAAPLSAVIDSGGNITIYTGNCALGGSQDQIWRLGTHGSATGEDLWRQLNLTQVKMAQTTGLTGSNYLATGIPFSSDVSSSDRDTKLYFFGGMCPGASATEDTWISAANYSSSMLVYSPSVSGKVITYSEGQVATRNLPISQAGHTMTALQPTYSNRTDGTQTQQQDFVLLGGQTQNAFINMSQVALFSLPQEAWTYFPVGQSSSTGHTDLTIRDGSTQVQPRSGHTATLSSDGSNIVIVGGWVGNVNTPATPQIAVLNVADSYGGQGDWQWKIPSSPSGSGLATNSGIYGHGAMMLPGNVLLILGGYTIPAPKASKWRRAATTQTANTQAYLYNVTSNSWLSEYTAPPTTSTEAMSSTGPLSRTSQKAGLGAGLGIGAVAVAALFVLYFWYARRQKRRREARDREIQNLSFASYPYGSDEWGIPHAGSQTKEVQVADSSREKIHYLNPADQRGWQASSAGEAERTGLLVEIPSPTRGLRRNVSGRGPYPYEKRASRNMEPIAERTVEEPPEMQMNDRSSLQVRTSALLGNPPTLDPFTEADPLRSNPVSLDGSPMVNRTSTISRDEEVKGWMEEWERAAQALLVAPTEGYSKHAPASGRQSPSKSDRTSSTLSEQSTTSSFSFKSGAGGGVTGLARSLSTRSAALLNSFTNSLGVGPSSSTHAPLALQPSSSDARVTLPSQQRRRPVSMATTVPTTRPETGSSLPPRTDSDFFSTARTSLARLQDEGQGLLGATPPSLNTPLSRSRYKSVPSSPIRENPNPGNRAKPTSWVGSVKRVISGYTYTGRSASMTTASALAASSISSPEKMRQDALDGDEEWERDEWGMAPRSPPKRTVSDATFWKSKRGAKDWLTGSDDEDQSTSPAKRRSRATTLMHPSSSGAGPQADARPVSSRPDTSGTAATGDTEEEDWDVERAAESRVVQLMFTVPRQRLRVVNCDVDGGSLVSFDDNEIPGKGEDLGRVDDGGRTGKDKDERL